MFIKRFFDLLISTIILILTSPLLLICTLAIKLNLGSPVIFKQQRPGYKGKPFYIYKFRTMLDLKDEEENLLPDSERITKLGAFLRKLSLDELPQLINVLKGEMSIVGPRPLLMRYIPYYCSYEKKRFDVLPGITGWAQVNGRTNISWDERFKLDQYYVENLSLLLDFKILLLTIYKVLKRENAVAYVPSDVLALDEERLYMSVKFRIANEEDYYSINEIFQNTVDSKVKDKFIYGCKGIENYLIDRLLKNGHGFAYFVAEIDKKVIGYIELTEAQSVLFLNNILFFKEYTSNGIGPRFLKYAIENYPFIESCKHMKLHVFDFNERALKWYKSLGFEKTDRTEVWTFDLYDLSKLYPIWSRISHKLIFDDNYHRYGFSIFKLKIKSTQYHIGLLGEHWFKLLNPLDLNDIRIFKPLRLIDNTRNLLVFITTPAVINPNILNCGKREFDTITLQTNLKDLYKILIANIGEKL